MLDGDCDQAYALVRPPGHHATRDQAMGFCYFNNIAIAALDALENGANRVAIWDFDAHHGNGTEAIVAGNPSSTPQGARRRPGPAHDCRSAGCRPHVCHPMKASTIRGIHSILSGAFTAAVISRCRRCTISRGVREETSAPTQKL